MISIIIPVYNASEFIIDALIHIYNQNVEDVEVVIVNDGSKDNSLELIKNFILDHDIHNIKLISQENAGLSAARNIGISSSSGDYIVFLDADDLLEVGYFENIKNIVNKFKPDIIQFNFSLFRDSHFEKVNSGLCFKYEGMVDISNNVLNDVFNYNSWYVWSRVYKRELFNNIEFPVGYNFEDALVVPDIFLNAKNIYFLNKSMYLYRYNPNSITRNKSKLVLKKNVDSLDFLLSKCIESKFINSLYVILFVHFFRVYLEYCFKLDGWKGVNLGWKKYSNYLFYVKNEHSSRIESKPGSVFLMISFLGASSYFVLNLLSKINGFIKFRKINF
ncbi:glycosyltransferase family 2 protein [Acinetobacter faecalis]|uniref:glycosyltransferase family 2 protein n=1 Tax=Acinetobacter faecalis TaxID=2665161 RepID=UPI002A91FD18|nr:glycosyltransferase [Acinetobacter faecalis]MDY6456247.1 glycosyltransferase [Acinetobacter faecalis]MDY6462021.1 glycosyltransferase [Acinetobacter faecalis]